MAITKEIGQIQVAKFGNGGYQDAQIGLTFQFGSKKNCWGISKFYGAWRSERSEHCKWSEDDRLKALGEAVMVLAHTLEKAKKRTVDELAGVPVECTFEDMSLKEWRVLEEVL